VRPHSARGPTELLAVGDKRWKVDRMALDPAGVTPQKPTKVKQAIAAGGTSMTKRSDFEGVASDASGRVFVLQEKKARVLVLNRAMNGLVRTIKLHVASDNPHIGASWANEPNARGEGLLLLHNGHMLIAKQRDPVRLIEFGPAGHAPIGYAPGRALADHETFTLPSGHTSTVEVLATWSLDPVANIESINDLALDADCRLHFVSSHSRCIGQLDADLTPDTPDTPVVARRTVELPAEWFASDRYKAEGLAFTDALGWLVALDLKVYTPNLYRVVLAAG